MEHIAVQTRNCWRNEENALFLLSRKFHHEIVSFLFASPENSKIRMAIGNFPDRVANFGAHRISLSTQSLMCLLQDIALRFLKLCRHIRPICIQLSSKLISSFHSCTEPCLPIYRFFLLWNIWIEWERPRHQTKKCCDHFHNDNQKYFRYGKNQFFIQLMRIV
jgi:hypothetical protein